MREYRFVTIEGHVYAIPPRLYRVPIGRDGGWMVQYTLKKETIRKYFSDAFFNNAANSYQVAMRHLTSEVLPIIYALPSLKDEISPNKESDTPVGITGPLWRITFTGRPYCVYGITVPQVGQSSRVRSVYIGTEKTWQSRCDQALERAIEIRNKAVEEYKEAAEELRLEAIAEINGDNLFQEDTDKRPAYTQSRVVHLDFKRAQLLKSRRKLK